MDVLRYPGPGRAPGGGCVVTIGAYDGIHIGHQALIRRVRAQAGELGIASAVVSFDQHPAMVVRPDSAPKLLCDLEQKLELLAATGLDITLLVHFGEDRAHESAEDFIREVLVGCLAAKAVVVGHDFHFGYKRQGDVPLLQSMGAELDFDVTGVHLYPDHPGGQPVSSTRIRRLLAVGDVAGAAELLGRPHQVRGVVVRGDRRGQRLGFPTANIAVPLAIALPEDGVYAGWFLQPDGVRRPAALSVGGRPTFYVDKDLSLLEAHVLDFDDDLYDQPARVEFVARLRAQKRFDAIDVLIEQMGRDVAETRRVLAIP